jgi:hypothetical protein
MGPEDMKHRAGAITRGDKPTVKHAKSSATLTSQPQCIFQEEHSLRLCVHESTKVLLSCALMIQQTLGGYLPTF